MTLGILEREFAFFRTFVEPFIDYELIMDALLDFFEGFIDVCGLTNELLKESHPLSIACLFLLLSRLNLILFDCPSLTDLATDSESSLNRCFGP